MVMSNIFMVSETMNICTFTGVKELVVIYLYILQNLNDKTTSATEFKNEILALSKIEHLNLVKFFGFVEQKDEHLIIVEYVGNGTLREHLDGK